MARVRCSACSGSGEGIIGVCSFCGGSGTIWVPDKTTSNTTYSSNRSTGSGGGSWAQNAFEDNFAVILFLVIWGWISYYGLNNTDYEWYWPVGIGFVIGWFAYWLFRGPLRIIGTAVKYIIGYGLLALLIYGIIQAIIALA
jgi:hypothetical protein